MTAKESMLLEALNKYDRAMKILCNAMNRRVSGLPVDKDGAPLAEDVQNLNEWVARWNNKICKKLVNDVRRIEEMFE